MKRIYGGWPRDGSNTWSRFALTDQESPGNGGIGNIHFPVNGVVDYDYGNPHAVWSNADDWLTYPFFTGQKRLISAAEWLNTEPGDPQAGYLDWWWGHLPHFEGRGPDGHLANWHRYIFELDRWKNRDGL